MSEREKARRALKKLEEVEAKRAEQRRLEAELRRSLERQAYDARDLYLHRASGGVSRALPEITALHEGRCAACGQRFMEGMRVRELLDDDGRVIARYHLECT
jgi:hypothetical protein